MEETRTERRRGRRFRRGSRRSLRRGSLRRGSLRRRLRFRIHRGNPGRLHDGDVAAERAGDGDAGSRVEGAVVALLPNESLAPRRDDDELERRRARRRQRRGSHPHVAIGPRKGEPRLGVPRPELGRLADHDERSPELQRRRDRERHGELGEGGGIGGRGGSAGGADSAEARLCRCARPTRVLFEVRIDPEVGEGATARHATAEDIEVIRGCGAYVYVRTADRRSTTLLERRLQKIFARRFDDEGRTQRASRSRKHPFTRTNHVVLRRPRPERGRSAKSRGGAGVSPPRAGHSIARESIPDPTLRCARVRRFPFTRSLELAGRRTRVEFPLGQTRGRLLPPDPSSSRVRRGPLGDAGRHARSGERRASRAPRHARAPPKVDGLACPTRSPRRQTGRRRALTARPRFQPDAVSSSLFLPRPRIRWSPRKSSSAATPNGSVPADARCLTERSWSSSRSFVGRHVHDQSCPESISAWTGHTNLRQLRDQHVQHVRHGNSVQRRHSAWNTSSGGRQRSTRTSLRGTRAP